jgi:polysaccharide biosynthesis/export protein
VLALALVPGLLSAPRLSSGQVGQSPPTPTIPSTEIAPSPPAATTPPASDTPIEGRIDPDSYRIGPGDEFAFRTSDLMDPKILRVGPSGDLLLPDVGPVPLAGLTLREAQTRVRERLRPYIRGKGFVLALHRPRRFRLPVLGDVERPGVVTLQAPARASDAIAAAGGVAKAGTHRGIQVRRGTDTLYADLVRYGRAGVLDADPLVFETDIVYVPASGNQVEVLGAVPHPGSYDFMPGDRLAVLVALAGGALPEAALESAALVRVQADGKRDSIPIRLSGALSSPGGSDDLLLSAGDRLFLPSRAHWLETPHVTVEGEVLRPGPYPVEEGVERLRSVLKRAGGYTEFADRSAVRVERASEEAEPDSQFLKLALEKDALLTPSERSYVVLKSRERNAISAPVGALLEVNDPRGDVTLRDGDRIVVPRRVPFVSVQGEVRAPGFVPYREGWKLEDYVRAVGDYTSRAMKSRTRITLSFTGRQVAPGEVRELRPGDVIWIPTKPDRNPWATLRDAVGVTAAAASIIIAVAAITK